MDRKRRIEQVLTEEFQPSALEVIDESHRHAGHAGAQPGGQTHYKVKMASAALAGLSRVAAHRKVTAALKAEFDSGLHALSIELG